MTEEEIKTKASRFACHNIHGSPRKQCYEGFYAGAMWAISQNLEGENQLLADLYNDMKHKYIVMKWGMESALERATRFRLERDELWKKMEEKMDNKDILWTLHEINPYKLLKSYDTGSEEHK